MSSLGFHTRFSYLIPPLFSSSVRAAKWLHFNGLLVGRNSVFANTDDLTDEELEEIGGVEYRALRLLTYIVAGYFVGSQLLSFLLIYPYLITHSKWDSVFAEQPRIVSKPWFAAFQTLSAYTGGGLSLADTSMIPFVSHHTDSKAKFMKKAWKS